MTCRKRDPIEPEPFWTHGFPLLIVFLAGVAVGVMITLPPIHNH